ncbi:MAG TPA: BTAD domain-containing putative transcriptional regulator [Anaerolineales bacterium]|jgi:WD40 repeat protein/class 3 adenylate cyclase
MLQIRLLGQFDVRLDGKRIVISSRAGQSLLGYLAMTAGTPHRREKLAGTLWPDSSDENARKNLRQELWRIRKAIPNQGLAAEHDYLLSDAYTITFNSDADTWLDVAILQRPDHDPQSLTSSLSLYQGELLPGFYDDWVVFERERIQNLFESKMERLVEMLVDAERWTGVQEQCERWLALGNPHEPAYRALMLSYSARGDMARVTSVYQRCVDDLRNWFDVEPSAETHAFYNGLLKGARAPRRIVPVQPSGTVTFLFTDIQGSTRLLDTLGAQYATSLDDHHKILRAAIQNWHGSEIDTQGDAFFVTFARALDAVQCAAEAQRRLAAHTWLLDEPVRVRMGLHTGEPLIASTGYIGMDVHRAARIGDAGHGGQVLLSQTTRDLVLHDLPHGMTIRDLGEHRLKDVKYPTPIYQLVIEGLQASFPPIKTKFFGTEAPTPGEPPFKGLQYFEETDSALFFGREQLTARLVNRLRETQFLSVIIGASGSGKSSLVRAGLIPALKNEKILIGAAKTPAGSSAWRFHIITPTAHPLQSLANELTRDSESVTAAAALLDDLATEPRSLSLFLLRKSPPAHTLLLIDQFEELFTLCRDEFEREAFIDNLLTAISPASENRPADGHITLVITLRADFYSHLAPYPELRDAVAQQQEYIGPMRMEELRSAIEEPARRGHWEFEPGLVDLILRDVGDEPGALPLLSHALLETWKRRAGPILTLKGYADAGGVRGAIAHTAETVYQNLNPQERAIARESFLRLTELGEGTEDTRRRASLAELITSADNPEEVHAVLYILADARLITLGEQYVEVAHEALIREWPTLREWLNQDREGLALHRRLTEAAHDWEILGRDPGALYRGAHLAQAQEWAALHPRALNAAESAFIHASIGQEKHEEQEREEQRQRDLAAARQLAETQRQSASRLRVRNRVITTVGSIALILALLAGLFGVQSNQNAVKAQSNFNRAESQRLALEANHLLTSGGSSEQIALLSLRSMNISYTPEGDAALAAAARLAYPLKSYNQAGPVWSAAFSPDGKYILVGDDNKTVKLWDSQTGQELRRFPGNKASFSPDGTRLLTQSFQEELAMWEIATGRQIYQINNGASRRSMVFSHDGRTILTSSEDLTVRRWDAETGREIGIFLKTPLLVRYMAISPDDRSLLTLSTTVQLWDLQTGREIRNYQFDASTLTRMQFSPDGNFFVSENTANTATLWDVKTGLEVRAFIGHTAPLFDLAFSPDSKYLLTSAGDKTVRLWDIHTGQELRRFNFAVFVAGLAFSPDGSRVLTGADDGIVRLWALHSNPPLLTINHGSGLSALAFSPDGSMILTGGEGGTARLWNAATGEKLLELVGHTDVINFGAAFSPDGKYIVTGSWDKTIRLWDARTGKQLHKITDSPMIVSDVRFSSDGKLLLSASDDGVQLWDVKTWNKIRQLGQLQGVSRAAFSPDARYVLTAAGYTQDGKVRLWDASTGQLIREYQGTLGPMFSVDFSPDMKYILGDGGYGNVVHVWDLQTGKELHQLVGHTGPTYSAVFSPDGKYIATASVDNTARLWDVQTGKELRRFTGHTAAVENVIFSPNGKYLLTGSDDGTAMLWDLDYHTTLQYLCGHLLRDFTPEERAQFEITDASPTCPAR